MYKGYIFFSNAKDSKGCSKFKENPLFIVILTPKTFFRREVISDCLANFWMFNTYSTFQEVRILILAE